MIQYNCCILSGVVNSWLRPLLEKGSLSQWSNGLGKRGGSILHCVPSHKRELHFCPPRGSMHLPLLGWPRSLRELLCGTGISLKCKNCVELRDGVVPKYAGDFVLSLRLMRHADSAPSAYGKSILWLSNFLPIRFRYFTIFCQVKPLSHSMELPYTEGAESACLISRRDNTNAVGKRGVSILLSRIEDANRRAPRSPSGSRKAPAFLMGSGS